MQLRNAKDDQLNKCISELSSSFRRCASESVESQQAAAQLPSSTTTVNKPRPEARPASSGSHFVTVIEVKESGKKAAAAKEASRNASATEESEDDRLDEDVAMAAAEEEDTQSNENVTGQTNTTDDESLAETGRGVQRNKSSDSSGFGSDGQSNVMRLINRNNAVLAAASVPTTSSVTKSSSTFSANNGDKLGVLSSSPTAATGVEMPKKRIPPR